MGRKIQIQIKELGSPYYLWMVISLTIHKPHFMGTEYNSPFPIYEKAFMRGGFEMKIANKIYNFISSNKTNYIVALVAAISWILSAFFGALGALLSKDLSELPRIIMCIVFAVICFSISNYWKSKMKEQRING